MISNLSRAPGSLIPRCDYNMADKTNERLEHEAREALVAADLSAKMKQWREQPNSPPDGGGASWLRILLLLLAFGGAAWWLWPKADEMPIHPQEIPTQQTAPIPDQQSPPKPEPQQPTPMAQKPAANRYLALAQSQYKAPDFKTEIRGDAPKTQDALNDARQALADRRPGDALDALQNVPDAYKTDGDYLRAHALFGLKKYAEAAAVFGQLTGSIRYGEAAQWYEVLALLTDFEGNKSVVLSKLKAIFGDGGHAFQREAEELLLELR